METAPVREEEGLNVRRLSFPDAPRVRLDRTIADLVSAAGEVMATQGRLRDLLSANHAITAQLDHEAVLRTIVDSARDLCSADQAMLTIDDGRAALEWIAAPAHPSGVQLHGGGAETPAPTAGRLTVPVRVHGTRYAELSLAPREGTEFSDDDRELALALAATGGFAIERALLYRESQQREEFAAASAAVTAALLGDQGDRALTLIADRMHALLSADTVFVAILHDDAAHYTVAAAHGEDPDSLAGSVLSIEGTLFEGLLTERLPIRLDERALRGMKVPLSEPYGPLLALPLETPARLLGAVFVTRARGGRSFTATELEVAAEFARHSSVAIELHAAREGQGRMRLFEDRGRIARDLHDRVIQQLFATGMQLQSVLGTLPPGRNADRVDQAVTSLDDAIAQIRRIIFTLSGADRSGQGSTGRRQVLEVVDALGSSLGVEPAVSFAGPVDTVLDAELTEHLLAVVSEATTNAVKHGHASEVSIRVATTSDGIAATVSSNGAAMTDSVLAGAGRRSGLANLEQRASLLGGSLTIDSEDGRTVLDWRVPLPASRARGTNGPGAEA